MRRRVVITDLDIVSPVGCDQSICWRHLQAGVSCASAIDRLTCCSLLSHHDFQVQAVCEVRDFDAAAWPLFSQEIFALKLLARKGILHICNEKSW